MNKILVIAPHADDEVLGCGATIAKYAAEGEEVYILIATNASVGAPELFSASDIEEIRKEALNAHKILGVTETYFLNFPAPALNSFPEYKIASEFAHLIKKINPNILFLPHPGDLHQDHNSIYRAALVAARPNGSSKINEIFCYETLSETEWAPVQGSNIFKPNMFIDVTNFIDLKIEAMREYKSQLKHFPHSRSIEALIALASFRGATVHINKCEAFEVERFIKN